MGAYSRVVVGVDFTECSRDALAQGVRLTGGKVTAAHVVERTLLDQLGSSLQGEADAVQERVVGHVRYGVERMLEEAPGASGSGVRIEVGSASGEMVRLAGEADADLLVMGAVGQKHSRGGVGTTAGRCVRHASMDVLLVRPGARGAYRHIVACVDFSDTSARALGRAAQLAKDDGARLTALHVFTPPPPAYPPTDAIGLWPIPAPDYAALTTTLRDAARDALDKAVHELGDAGRGIDLHAEVVEDSSYARGICEFANARGADLVVIGTQGRSGLRYMLLGSTAERVLRDASCSVLAVKPTGDGA